MPPTGCLPFQNMLVEKLQSELFRFSGIFKEDIVSETHLHQETGKCPKRNLALATAFPSGLD